MANPPLNNDNNSLFKYYKQHKQRIDLNIDMNTQKIIGLTKLTFIIKDDEKIEKMPDILFLYLNAENMYINNMKILGNENMIKNNENLNLNELKNCKDLEFNNTSPFHYYKYYLEQLYGNIEELESYKNINRVEWEIRQKGNLIIKIPTKLIYEDFSKNVNVSNLENNNLNKNKEKNISDKGKSNINPSHNLMKKIKIIINYEIIEKNIGIIFQEFYEPKTDNSSYKICYTHNFYYNTPYWVPCIYDLKLQINWTLYLYVPNDYMSYTSCSINKILKDKEGKKLIISKTKEPTTARNIGFIVIKDKTYKKYYDNNNKNFVVLGNENKKEIIEKNLINNKLISTLYYYYYEFFDINYKKNINSVNIIVFIPYLLFNCPYQGFNKFLKLKEDNYLNFIKFPNLYILPEKFMYNESIPDISKFQLSIISRIFITNYIGGLIIEKTYADFWIINGLENWLSDLFLNKVYNNYYIKTKLYKLILKLKKLCKEGKETLPLYSNNFTNPIDIQLNTIYNLKSKILFHILESKIDKIFIQKALINIINERNKTGYNISTEDLIKLFNINCGINLQPFMDLYVYKTGMFEISLNYIYNHKNNSIDITIHQEQIAKKYYDANPFFKIKDVNYDFLNEKGNNFQIIDQRIKPNKNFNLLININVIQTNGITIMNDIHEIQLASDKNNFTQNFPLRARIRQSKLKKKREEFIQDLIVNTGVDKIFTNNEIKEIFRKNPVLWIRIDSELSSLCINKINQEQILYEYIKIFKEGDCIGQMESLNNIGKNKTYYEKSLQILKIFISCPDIFYKIKQYALKIFVKIIKKIKKVEEYQFLLDIFDELYNELLKNKSKLNLDVYYIMKDIIKYLGEYSFIQFYSEESVNNSSSIENKIINKLVCILVSNELNTILGFDDCYIMSDIMIHVSKFNLQEKSIFVLEKILKYLRTERLKRSVNEIFLISSFNALINLLIHNEFFFSMRKYFKFNLTLTAIFYEVNYFINHETENYELNTFINYFKMFMIFYKSKSYIGFSDFLVKFVLGEEYNNTAKMAYFTCKRNLDMISKIKALFYLFENNELYFDSLDDKIAFLSSLKTILYSPICYLRGDCRNIMEYLYDKFYLKDISEIGAGNNNFKNVNFLHLFNKHRINFTSKKYADKDWLNNFINEKEDNTLTLLTEGENRSININIFQTECNNIDEAIKNYMKKYKGDNYFLKNKEIDTTKPFNEILIEVVDKLLGHPNSKPFSFPINKDSLNDLYEDYINAVKYPIDLVTIKNKIQNNYYENFIYFNNDICLMFYNCRLFNEKNSLIYLCGIHLQDYYDIITFPLKKMNLKNDLTNRIVTNNEINSFEEDITISISNSNEQINEYNDETMLNKKRNNETKNTTKKNIKKINEKTNKENNDIDNYSNDKNINLNENE